MARRGLMLWSVAALAAVAASGAAADSRPIQLSVVTPIQLFSEETPIGGLRLNLIYGRNASLTGVDLGFVNHVTGPCKGVQWGAVGWVGTDFTGWQDNFVSVTKGRFEGFQSGAVNSMGSGEAFQLGIVNHAGNMSGFQLGFVNYCDYLKGLQIGVLNIIKQKEGLPVLPIVNWNF
jgi:hypothetical protein